MAKKGSKSVIKTLLKYKWATFAVLVLLIVLTIAASFWYSDYKIEKAHQEIAENQGWQLLETEKFGNEFCIDACKGVVKKYKDKLDIDSAPYFFNNIINKKGFTLGSSSESCKGDDPKLLAKETLCSFSGKKEKIELFISITKDSATSSDSYLISVSVSY